jgi:hypothetical protein
LYLQTISISGLSTGESFVSTININIYPYLANDIVCGKLCVHFVFVAICWRKSFSTETIFWKCTYTAI